MQWFINMGFSPTDIITALVFAFLLVYPTYRILDKIGINGWFSVLTAIPFVSIVALWILAFIRWPKDEPKVAGDDSNKEEKQSKKSKPVQNQN